MSCRICGGDCPSEGCELRRLALREKRPNKVSCTRCGAAINVGFRSIKGRCATCDENDPRHELTSVLTTSI